MVEMPKREMGPFETQYKKIHPHGQQDDQAILRKYPEHREFIFEQFLKSHWNSVGFNDKTGDMSNLDVTKNLTPIIWFSFIVSLVSVGLIMFFRG